jgi:superfamily II DNA helicase RecQ
VDAQLTVRLRSWRLREAKRRGIPAYAVFHDATLDALAALRPRTEAELLSVPGFGPARIARFGTELLQVIAEPAPPAGPEPAAGPAPAAEPASNQETR